MALTTAVRLRLEGKAFDTLFDHHRVRWEGMVKTARAVMAEQVPGGQPTIDDVRKVLLPMVELDHSLSDHLAGRRLTQKYWISDFTDYILERVLEPKTNKVIAED